MESARKALSKATDDQLMKSWRLLFGGKVLDDRPRHLIVADTICHLAHHCGQLTVYMRLNDKPGPAIYGASADSSWCMAWGDLVLTVANADLLVFTTAELYWQPLASDD